MAKSMQAYFREALDASLRTSKITITESAQAYVVHLLNEFSRSEKAFAGINHGEKVIMAHLLERAHASEEHEALRIYRHLGDISLYLLGFFKEASAKRVVPATYYKDMGSVAYSCASDLSRPYAISSAATFRELSDRFSDMVIVLEHMAYYQQHDKKLLI